jgi:hypothetical protein
MKAKKRFLWYSYGVTRYVEKTCDFGNCNFAIENGNVGSGKGVLETVINIFQWGSVGRPQIAY